MKNTGVWRGHGVVMSHNSVGKNDLKEKEGIFSDPLRSLDLAVASNRKSCPISIPTIVVAIGLWPSSYNQKPY